jgi:hypothetical protein
MAGPLVPVLERVIHVERIRGRCRLVRERREESLPAEGHPGLGDGRVDLSDIEDRRIAAACLDDPLVNSQNLLDRQILHRARRR